MVIVNAKGITEMDKIMTTNYVKAIAEARNISIAADNLGISQPALSAYLKKLEEQVGTILFDRSKKPLTLTESGKVYLQYADKVDALNKEFLQQISDLQDLKSGNLTIGGASFFNVAYVPDAVAEFISRYPGVDVEIIDGKIPEISMEALNGKIDVFITPTAEDKERFSYEKLLDEKIFICVPEQWEVNRNLGKEIRDGYPVLSRQDFEKLKDSIFILLHEDQHIGQKMNAIFGRYEFRPQHSIVAEQTMTSLALTRAGVGVSLVTESTIANSNMREYPRLYLADEDICSREMFAAYPKNKHLSRATSEFIRILKRRAGSI